MAKNILHVLLCFLVLTVAACNTVEGMGRDIKSAGEAMTGAAQKNSDSAPATNH